MDTLKYPRKFFKEFVFIIPSLSNKTEKNTLYNTDLKFYVQVLSVQTSYATILMQISKLLMEKSKGGKNKHNFKDLEHISIKIRKGLNIRLRMMFKSPFNGASRFSIT